MNIFAVIADISLEIWRTFCEASPYIIFGLFVAGLIQIFVDKEKIAKHLGKPGLKSVLKASLFGVPLPLCSCGVIPTAMSLRKNGASKGAVVSFMISTPETGVDSIAISFALLDPIMAVFRPITAFFTAIIAGIMENTFGVKEDHLPEKPRSCIFCSERDGGHIHRSFQKFSFGMRYAFTELLGDIAKWLTLGIATAGVISYFVPQGFIERYLGSNFISMLIMLVVGIPLYICASASTPIAAALIAKGMSPGVALVFLMAGPATNTAGILAVGKFLGKRAAVLYLASISVCALIAGLLLNQIYAVSGINIKTTLGKAAECVSPLIQTGAAILLIALMINAVRHKRKCSI